MNILNINMSLDPVTGGGTAERTVQISRALARAGHQCTILTLDIGADRRQEDHLKEVHIVYLPCMNRRFYIPGFSYAKITSLVADADVIHLMGHWTLINVLVYIVARRQGKPYVVCPAGALPLFGRSRIIKKAYNLIIGNRIIKNAHRHIAITRDEVSQFIPYGIAAETIDIIPNGINVSDYDNERADEFRDKFGLSASPIVLFVGRLNKIKGPDLLLQAFCSLKENLSRHHLVFIGPDGGMLSELKDMATACDVLQRVHFLGYLGGDEKSQAYHAADLLVIPSRQEAMSIVVLEAGASGTPVLITDQCGFNEVAHIDGGKVVPATVRGLQSGLLEMLACSGQLQSMGFNLRSYVLSRFTWDAAAFKYLSMYNNLLSDHC